MSESSGGALDRQGIEALAYMEKALELLDTFEPGVEVAAHLDLAICRLRDALARGANGECPQRQPPLS
jgi:hypothetical protein